MQKLSWAIARRACIPADRAYNTLDEIFSPPDMPEGPGGVIFFARLGRGLGRQFHFPLALGAVVRGRGVLRIFVPASLAAPEPSSVPLANRLPEVQVSLRPFRVVLAALHVFEEVCHVDLASAPGLPHISHLAVGLAQLAQGRQALAVINQLAGLFQRQVLRGVVCRWCRAKYRPRRFGRPSAAYPLLPAILPMA